MPDSPTPLDLDAIRVRADARRDYADERPESLHVPEDYAALADESAADVPALVEEVKRLRSESQRFYENRNLWQKRAEKAEAERDVARAEVARLTAAPSATREATEDEVDREALRRFVDSFCDDEAGEVEHVVSADCTSGFALTGGNDAHAVLRKAASALWPGESRTEVGRLRVAHADRLAAEGGAP